MIQMSTFCHAGVANSAMAIIEPETSQAARYGRCSGISPEA
jgi:hypothetical protein